MCLFQINQQGQLECLFTSFLFKPAGINDTEMEKPPEIILLSWNLPEGSTSKNKLQLQAWL